MKVLEINSVCGFGSTGNIAVDIYRELCKNGNDACIAYGRGDAPEDVRTYRIGKRIDNYIHAGLSRITDRQGFYSTEATRKFVEWMQQYNPDLIHLHNLHGYYINIEILFRALAEMKKPVIWTLHDCWAFTGHCAHFTAAKCERWKEMCEHCPQKNEYPASFLLDASRKNYQEKSRIFTKPEQMVIVTPSQWLADMVRESYLKKYPVQVIYNGVDLDVFKPTESDLREKLQLKDKNIILGVANVWSSRKGLAVFELLAKQLDSSCHIILVGVTEKQRRQLPDNITCLERTANQQELAALYSTADLYLNPSEEETMGLTTVEALACGTNVLVNDSTALPEIVGNKAECIYKNSDVIGSVLESLKFYKNIEDNRNMVVKYEKCKQYEQYIKIYEEVLKNK